jgi:hypothetical protein
MSILDDRYLRRLLTFLSEFYPIWHLRHTDWERPNSVFERCCRQRLKIDFEDENDNDGRERRKLHVDLVDSSPIASLLPLPQSLSSSSSILLFGVTNRIRVRAY